MTEAASCFLCGMMSGIDYHHTIPRSYGGENSRQVPLCSGHHSLVHKMAGQLYKHRDVGRIPLPPDIYDTRFADYLYLVKLIVNARVSYERAKAENTAAMRRGCAVTLSGDTLNKIDRLKNQLGLSNQASVVDYAVDCLCKSLSKG